jgi:hypothetical protein
VPGISINFRLNDVETGLAPDEFLQEVAPALRQTVIDFLKPVEVNDPEKEIKMRIRAIPPSGNRSLAGRRLQDWRMEDHDDSAITDNSGAPFNETSRWGRWAEVYARNKALNSSNRTVENASSNGTSNDHLAQFNFGGHRATPSELLGLSNLSSNLGSKSLDTASSSIASRLMAGRNLTEVINDVQIRFDESTESAPERRLAVANFEIAVTVALSNAVAQAAAQLSMSKLKDNPGQIGTTFNSNYLLMCNKPCQGVPSSWEASSPSITQVYILASDTQRLNTTTTLPTTPPPPTAPPPPSQENFSYGIIIGVGSGLFLVLAPLLGIAIYIWRMRVYRAKQVQALPQLPPAPGRQWEAKWEVPESAKIVGADGLPLTGHHTKQWQGGGTYEGQVKDGTREGDGRMKWPNGKSYAGTWEHGRPHGHGLLHAPGERGWTYNGQFKDGQRHGLGRCESLSRRIWYDGEWSGGVQSGLGENGNLPNLPGAQRSNVPPPVAHLWRMEQGEQQEHLGISKVAPDKQSLMGLALEATVEDIMKLSLGDDYMPGGEFGPPESPLQLYSRLWGICFGRPDDWLPSSWGALVITRIMENGALARWNLWHIRDMGENASPIQPNSLIWRVNGVEGDIGLMAQELSAEENRRRVQLAISNPPHVKFLKAESLLKQQRNVGSMPSVPTPQHLWHTGFNKPAGMPALPGMPGMPHHPGHPPRLPPLHRPEPEMTGPVGNLRRAALQDLAHAALPDLPKSKASMPGPPHAPPPGARPSQAMPALPMLPDVPHGRDGPSGTAQLPPLPDIPPHLSTLSLPPPPPNVSRPPPGRPLTPGETPGALAGPPPPKSKSGAPTRVGYRAVAAASRAARDQGLPDPRVPMDYQSFNQMNSPDMDPPG